MAGTNTDVYKEPYFDPVIEKEQNKQENSTETESKSTSSSNNVLGNLKLSDDKSDTNNLLNVSTIPKNEFEPQNIIKTTLPPSRTITKTYTRTSSANKTNFYNSFNNGPKVPKIPSMFSNNQFYSENQNNYWNVQKNNEKPDTNQKNK